MRNIVIVIFVIVVVVLAGGLLWYAGGRGEQNAENAQKSEPFSPTAAQNDTKNNVVEDTATVIYTDAGFSPDTISVKRGTKVTFINQSSSLFWPASALHPTHTLYPDSNVEKCGTPEELLVFDACRGVGMGGSYLFTLNEIGSWKYHDHLSPGRTGTIVVQ